MIGEDVYDRYLEALLRGDSSTCLKIVDRLLDVQVPPVVMYVDLLQRSLYRIGELWEHNRISVATEHLATAITERILAAIYPSLLGDTSPHGRTAILCCSVNEYHQIGARMVADLMESTGWNVSFLGANTPIDDLLSLIDERAPEFVGLSVSLYFNMAGLHRLIDRIHANFRNLDIIVGGQAFRWGGSDIAHHYPQVTYIPSLANLEQTITAA
ncbi:MAG: cobalamin-dependent protein [Desulfofustis sp.]|jgi:methanogenic corrinoid protein MtbC1|nr:cobalamin-dependent protein [Desulfofustis sp.]